MVVRVESQPDIVLMKQDAALCIMLSVAVVETFVNVFFRVAVTEERFRAHEGPILHGLETRLPLAEKLRTWPELVFGQALDWGSGSPQRFTELRRLRNSLMHFTSSHETFSHQEIEIRGLADTAAFDGLSPSAVRQALITARGMVREILILRGLEGDHLTDALHLWTGTWE